MEDLLDLIFKIHRPRLGEEIPITTFRAFRVFSEINLEDMVGEKGTIILFQNAGRDLGKKVGQGIIDKELKNYIKNVTEFVKDAKIGILIPSEVSEHKITVGLEECITCSGMPNIGKRICHFETGFVAGIVEEFLGKKVRAYESKCNANGEGICEVTVELNNIK